MTPRFAVLIPTFNHYKALDALIGDLNQFDVDILIVDDGSYNETQTKIENLTRLYKQVQSIRLEVNQGKGIAVQTGLRLLYDNGYTHAFQIDADGQHSLEHFADFIQISLDNPHALISGNPLYDHSVPLARKIGRYLTHFWVWVETLSWRISDSMCGFRIYPLKQTCCLLNEKRIGSHMDFDTEIMVRLFWSGIPTLMIPVKVRYPKDNISNFRLLKDNWRITKMHTRLVFEMLTHLPSIVKKRPNYQAITRKNFSVSWASLEERGTIAGLYFLSFVFKVCGRRFCQVIGFPIVLYYYLSSKTQRFASKAFLDKVFQRGSPPRTSTLWNRLTHYMHFFDMMIDKLSVWINAARFKTCDVQNFEKFKKIMKEKRGGVLLVSHLGNMDFCRALANEDHQKRLHIFVHTKNSKRFHQMIHFLNPNAQVNFIEVTECGIETMIFLKDCVAKGDWVVIAADRFPVRGSKHVSYVPFLGELAPFAHGPYIIGSLLSVPVYTAVAVKEKQTYKVFIELFSEKIDLSSPTRLHALNTYAQQYAQYLEKMALTYYYEWFNFFDFWKKI